MISGLWLMVYGIWFLVYDLCFVIHSLGLRVRNLGVWFMRYVLKEISGPSSSEEVQSNQPNFRKCRNWG